MANRELSNTLRNLKFMQRAIQRGADVKAEKEENSVVNTIYSNVQQRRCTVIIEGDPHPGALRGRMSFQNFNPLVDKLNESSINIHQPSTASATNASDSDKMISDRENGVSQMTDNDETDESEHKRKKPETEDGNPSPSKVDSNGIGSNGNNKKKSHKKKRKNQLDWNVLRPPKT